MRTRSAERMGTFTFPTKERPEMTHTSIGMAWWWFLIIVLSMGLCLAWTMTAQGHDHVILACSKNIPIKEVFFISSDVLENGMYSEAYAKYKGGPIYIEALSVVTAQYPGEDHDPFPTFYVIDFDGDGKVDIVFQDTTIGEAPIEEHCKNILPIDEKDLFSRREL